MSKEELYLAVHFALHSSVKELSIQHAKDAAFITYLIQRASNGCRSIKIGTDLFMEQNLNKNSKYADLARQGHTITWIIKDGQWGLIQDDKIVRF